MKQSFETDQFGKQTVTPVVEQNNYAAEIKGITEELDNKPERIATLETQLAKLQGKVEVLQAQVALNKLPAGDNAFVVAGYTLLETQLAKLQGKVEVLQAQVALNKLPAGDNAFVVAGYTFRAIPTAKQDAMKDGINVVGKPGVALEVSDGANTAVVARITYDHRLQRMVLSTGAGVN